MRDQLGPDDPRHGTYNGYVNYACRCPDCTRANRDYQRTYRANPHARDLNAARSKATQALIRRHRDEFYALLDAEYARRGIVLAKVGRPRSPSSPPV